MTEVVETVDATQWPSGCADTISCYHKGSCAWPTKCQYSGLDIRKTMDAKVASAPYPEHMK